MRIFWSTGPENRSNMCRRWESNPRLPAEINYIILSFFGHLGLSTKKASLDKCLITSYHINIMQPVQFTSLKHLHYIAKFLSSINAQRRCLLRIKQKLFACKVFVLFTIGGSLLLYQYFYVPTIIVILSSLIGKWY